MKYEIIGGVSYPALEVTLEPGQKLVSEAGAMAWMDSHVKVETAMRGGLLKSLARAFVTGESLFQNSYHVEGKPGLIAFVPGPMGQIVDLDLDGELFLEKGAYLVSEPGIELQTKFEGLKGLFNEGVFTLRAVGKGKLFFNAYGAVEEIHVDGDYIVDNGYAVAWEPTLSYTLTKARKIRSFLFGDQLLLRFSGRGRLWCQSHSPTSLANFMHPYRRVQQNN
ncbi:MAG: TIGR00266 family protein [Planctomycetota bacterium]